MSLHSLLLSACLSLCVWMCLCSFLGVVYVMLFVCTIFFPYFLPYKIFISLQMFSSISVPFFLPFLSLSRFLSFRWNHFSVYLLKSAFFLLFLLYLMWVQGNILNNKQQIYWNVRKHRLKAESCKQTPKQKLMLCFSSYFIRKWLNQNWEFIRQNVFFHLVQVFLFPFWGHGLDHFIVYTPGKCFHSAVLACVK